MGQKAMEKTVSYAFRDAPADCKMDEAKHSTEQKEGAEVGLWRLWSIPSTGVHEQATGLCLAKAPNSGGQYPAGIVGAVPGIT